MTPPTRLAALLAAPLLLLSACGADEGGDDMAAAETSDAGLDAGTTSIDGEVDAGREEGAESADGEGGGGEAGGTDSGDALLDEVPAPAAAGRQLARTARLVVEVEDVEEAAAKVSAAATRAGGFIAESDVRAGVRDDGQDAFGVITIRVPADSLDETVADLGEVGVRVVTSSVGTEDLTDQLVDTQAQLRNLQALEGELLELLADVRGGDPDAAELLVVFDQVTQVRGQIERLQAQRAAFTDRVALATVTVELTPVPVDAVLAAQGEEPTVLEEAWEATRAAFGVLGELLTWTVVTILPVAAVVLGLPVLVLLALRRRRGERPAPPRAVDPPPAPAAPNVDPRDGAAEDAPVGQQDTTPVG